MKRIMQRFDMFYAAVPTLNLSGKTRVTTLLGGCASIFLMTLLFLFALLKLEHLVTRKNPTITVFEEPLSMINGDGVESFDMRSDNFMMAFAAEDDITKEPKSDPRFVQWVASFTEYDS